MSADGSSFFELTAGDLGIRVRGNTNPIGTGITEAPSIVDITDVPDDHGGYVNLVWGRSLHDAEGGSPPVKRYQVWRKRHETLAPILGNTVGSGTRTAGPYEHGLTGPAWEVVGTVPATGNSYYELTVATECDISGADTCWTYFCVTGHTGLMGDHFDSEVDRGYSIDNLGTEGEPEGDEGHGSGWSDRSVLTLKPPEPNPAGYSFMLEFELGEGMPVDLAVYDVKGRRVAQLADGDLKAGAHTARWFPGSNGLPEVPPGLYFVRLAGRDRVRTAKVILLK
jgi:hypothetical protein